jgi:hypothetical protein
MFFALSNMVRPEAILIIVSLLGFAIITTINKLNTISIKSKLKDIFLPIGCTILAYFIGTSIISQFFVVTGLSPYGLSNNFPLYKFVIGLNHSTSGSFSKEDADYLFESQFFIDNPDLRDKEALDIIQERLSVSPSKLGFLFAKKARAMWSCNPSWYPAFNSIDFNREINIFNTRIPLNIILYIFTTVDFIFFILIFLFGIISMYTAFKSKESFSIQIIVAIFFIVTFFTYCLIEVQHRYCYLIFPTLFIIASIGFERINENYLTSSPKK